jgi:CheY-like chemotaxis protein
MNRILVIDDDQAIQKALKRLFEAEGYEVEVSGDGKSALETVRAVAPTAIILDLRLPFLSGQMFAERSAGNHQRCRLLFSAPQQMCSTRSYYSNLALTITLESLSARANYLPECALRFVTVTRMMQLT